MSPGSSNRTDDLADPYRGGVAGTGPPDAAVFFDGLSSRRRPVKVTLKDQLEISEDGLVLAAWAYAGIRRADGPPGILRISCSSAPPLARLELRDAGLAAELESRCPRLDDHLMDRRGVAKIVGWSLAATVSIVLIVLFAIPLLADRLAPFVPGALERRLGDVAESQINAIFPGRPCDNGRGQAAWTKLVNAVGKAAELELPIRTVVLSSVVPNAFALPGGKVFLLDGLLSRAQNPDEIAGILAHEFGHLKHRDGVRNLIYNGGTSFLTGLLFGDVTGSGALIFTSRSLMSASYSREAEESADTFSIDVMHRLGRPTRPMGDLMFRVTGKEADKSLSILANHPLTEDRLERMSEANRPPSGPPLLTAEEWSALKAICHSAN